VALVLSTVRVRRPAAWALGATGSAFVVVKTTESGAEFASAAWSLVMPSVVLRDLTDLVALPGLAIAWWSWRWAGRVDVLPRRRALLAIGSMVLPLAVVATAATSCDRPDGVGSVDVYEGLFSGATTSQLRLIADVSRYRYVEVTAQGGIEGVRPDDSSRLGRWSDWRWTFAACSPSQPTTCWRAGPGDAVMESTTDAGRTWQRDYALGRAGVEQALDEEGDEHCGARTDLGVTRVAVLDTKTGPLVAAAAANAGLLVRAPSGHWKRWSVRSLESMPSRPWLVTPSATATAPPTGAPGTTGSSGTTGKPSRQSTMTLTATATPTPTLTPVEAVTPAYPAPSDQPTRTPKPLPCASPATRVTTPDPRNGPPITSKYCAAS